VSTTANRVSFRRLELRDLDAIVMNLAVAPKHRRKHIAAGLLDQLFVVTAGEGRRGYTLEVRVSNDVAINLYEKAGFKARGVRRGYYTDNREDALIMWRDPEPAQARQPS
jgi:[ribosomal protein S18]-alanine N-acetyltransferase